MKQKILSLFLSGTFIFTMITIPTSVATKVAAEEENKKIIWVAPYGDDSNEGTKESPLATLNAAKNRVQAMKKQTDMPIEVVFRGGEYRISNTVNFTASDSGTAENPIVYRAYDGEKVEFKGSIEVDETKGKRVTDTEILSRMYSSVHDKVVCFDLKEFGFTQNMVYQPVVRADWRELVGGEINGVYLDGIRQTVAEWPNGDGNYTRWEKALTGDTIQYTQTQPNRWGKASGFWLMGYPSWDWQVVRQSVLGVDTQAKTITACVEGSDTYQFKSYQSRRWKAQNLLEEIDVPGEYYIDPTNLKLYLYPSKSLSNTKMEISILKDEMIKITSAENITFEGIAFTQTRGIAMYMTNVRNIDILNCNFDSVLSHAVQIFGTEDAETDRDFWQRQKINGSYDCDIIGCVFNDIGGAAIEMDCGNLDTLTPSNNVIKDNIIYRANLIQTTKCVIMLRGCGATVENNNISKCPFQAIRHYGNDFIIRYNEIYDVVQEGDDCGAIYCGRNTLQRGTEISYNFIHDLYPTDDLPFKHQSAIYWDDRQTGMNAHHNIIVNSPMDILSNGSVDVNYSENISVNINSKLWRFTNGGYCVNHNDYEGATNYRFGSFIKHPEIYYAHYPMLPVLFSYRSDDPELAKYNSIKNNLAVNSKANEIESNTLKYGDLTGNLEIDECSDFVDPEKMDYRIKKDSETGKKVSGILTDEFDIEKIGMVNNVQLNEETSPFEQLYPENGSKTVQSSGVEFVWDKAFGASIYRLVIATDPELKNVIYDQEVPYNIHVVEELKPNKVYYWKVYAINRSRDLLSEWESSSCVYSFKTTIYDKIDTIYLNEEIEIISKKVSDIVESEKIGEYPVGTKEAINKKIFKANLIKKFPLSILKQKVVDTMTNQLSSAFNKLGMTNKGFLDIGEYLADTSSWSGDYTIRNDGSIAVVGSASTDKQAGTTSLGKTTGSCIYSMDVMLNTNNWAMIGFAKFIDVPPYQNTNTGYAICAKDDVLELQLSTGTTHTVVETVNKSFANDGEYHHLEFGFIEIGIGNLVVVYVDGEPWIEYLDIFNTGVNTSCEISMYIVDNEKELIAIKPASETSSPEEFDKVMERNLHKAVKEVLDKFDTDDKVSLFKNGAKKVFTPKGVFDVSHAPNTMIDGSIMIAFDKVDEIFDVETLEENGKCYIIGNETKEITNVGKVGEFTMVSVSEVLELLGHRTTWASTHETLVDGTIIIMNNGSCLDKAQELMTMLEPYKSDYIFE